MDILDKEDYKKLLEFSKGLNPIDINFQENTLKLILQYFDFSGAAFPIIDDNGYYHRLAYANFNQLSMVIYNNYCYEQDFFAPANYNKNLEKTVLMVDDFMTFDEYESSALYNDVLSRNNFYYEALVLLRGEHNEYIGAVAVYHKRDSFGFTEKERLILKEIGIIIEKQFQFYLHLHEKNLNSTTIHNLLFRLPIGMILCNSNFQILQINQEAMRILELFTGKNSINSIEKLIKDQILPIHIQCGMTQYHLQGKMDLEISIEHLITKDSEKNQYLTNYAIFFQYIREKKDIKWINLMESKGITKRECQIADFLRMGYTNAKIAENLGISENTVKRHKEKIYKKLEINRVNQLNLLYEQI
ncbi:helix-turn-helix transcriptional regulator [Clostridium lundense]|uniref:helix-turn-helix transcriptional regulator n=1 Tax=Clostridium lundense TaxID=319475 RepID=UPI000487043B|nr:helix-turn-helix transcriptional regulator [Clostridium lundense]